MIPDQYETAIETGSRRSAPFSLQASHHEITLGPSPTPVESAIPSKLSALFELCRVRAFGAWRHLSLRGRNNQGQCRPNNQSKHHAPNASNIAEFNHAGTRESMRV